MKISILISSYNKANYIDECIQSCLKQTSKNFEIILLDNYSNDDTDLIINRYKQNNNIIFKKKKKISKISAVNQIDILKTAYYYASGDIICFLDADDFFNKKKLETIQKIFSQKKHVEVIFDTPRILKNRIFIRYIKKKKFLKTIWPTTFPTSSISIKRSFLNAFFEDYTIQKFDLLEIDFRITTLAFIVYKNYFITDEVLTTYRIVSDGIMSNLTYLSKKWWIKRSQAHCFLKEIFENHNIKYTKNYDYYLTKIIVKLLHKFFK